MSEQPARSYTAIAIAIVIAGVLISASLYVAVEAPTRTTTTTRTVTTTETSSQTTAAGTSSQTACSEITVNGTGYCSLDVTDNVTFLQESANGLLNAPVTFMGVTFESTCPQPDVFYCVPESQFAAPGAISGGSISLELVFPDSDMQDISAPIYPSTLCCQVEYYLASAETSAGFLLVGDSTTHLRVILLVEPWQQPTPTALANSANNLQLQLFLNSSSSANGLAVSVIVDDYNTLGSANNVTAANDWHVGLSGLDGEPCGDGDGVVGFAVAEGHYTPSNITAAKFLDLVNPKAAFNCPLYLGYGSPTGFLFVPMSEAADSYGCIGVSPTCPTGGAFTGASGAGAITGYWDPGGAFTSFPRGTYTVLGEDEWGDSALAYFTVS
jgi:hypothetical protein